MSGWNMRIEQRSYKAFLDEVTQLGLLEPMQRICRAHGVLLQHVFEQHRGSTSVHFARGRIWAWLLEDCHKSKLEIARLFGRNYGTVSVNIDQWMQRHRSALLTILPPTG